MTGSQPDNVDEIVKGVQRQHFSRRNFLNPLSWIRNPDAVKLLTGLLGAGIAWGVASSIVHNVYGIDYSTPNFDDYLDQGGDPASPTASHTRLYSKASLLYTKNPSAGVSKVLTDAITHGSAQHDSTTRSYRRYLSSANLDFLSSIGTTTQTGTVGRVHLCPIIVPYLMTFDTIGCVISTKGGAGTTVTMGIYPSSSDAPDGTAPLLSVTMPADGASTGFEEVAISDLQLSAGEYFMALETADTVIIFNRYSTAAGTAVVTNVKYLTGCYYDRSGGYGALTNPCPATTAGTSGKAAIFLRVKSIDA